MTIYAFVTPYDITIWGSVLFGVSIAFLVLVIVGIIVRCKILTLIICFIGVTLGLIYVAYDTQLIIGGRKYELSEEDYVVAAVMLYADFVMIFLYLL